MNSCSQVVIELLLAKAYHLPDVVSDITNVSVHIQFDTATFQTDHIGKVIAAASAFSCCQFLRALMSCPCGWEAYMRGREVGGSQGVFKAGLAEQQPPVSYCQLPGLLLF